MGIKSTINKKSIFDHTWRLIGHGREEKVKEIKKKRKGTKEVLLQCSMHKTTHDTLKKGKREEQKAKICKSRIYVVQ